MAAYPPTTFSKGAEQRVARSWGDHWRLIFDGWTTGGPVPVPPNTDPVYENEFADRLAAGLPDALGGAQAKAVLSAHELDGLTTPGDARRVAVESIATARSVALSIALGG